MQPIKGIGKGAYGIVCSAHIGTTSEKVAVKKIPNAFENEIDARRTLREVTLLRQLKHKNVIALKDIMMPPNEERAAFKDVYLVYELMDTDLHQIIRSKQPLTDGHFQYFVHQVCSLCVLSTHHPPLDWMVFKGPCLVCHAMGRSATRSL